MSTIVRCLSMTSAISHPVVCCHALLNCFICGFAFGYREHELSSKMVVPHLKSALSSLLKIKHLSLHKRLQDFWCYETIFPTWYAALFTQIRSFLYYKTQVCFKIRTPPNFVFISNICVVSVASVLILVHLNSVFEWTI